MPLSRLIALLMGRKVTGTQPDLRGGPQAKTELSMPFSPFPSPPTLPPRSATALPQPLPLVKVQALNRSRLITALQTDACPSKHMVVQCLSPSVAEMSQPRKPGERGHTPLQGARPSQETLDKTGEHYGFCVL